MSGRATASWRTSQAELRNRQEDEEDDLVPARVSWSCLQTTDLLHIVLCRPAAPSPLLQAFAFAEGRALIGCLLLEIYLAPGCHPLGAFCEPPPFACLAFPAAA